MLPLDDKTVQDIAFALANQLHSWQYYSLIFAVALVAGALGSFAGAYLKRRGENLATKADFNEVLRQIRATTLLTESVRSEISNADWTAREWKNIRRIKAEELLVAVNDAQAALDAMSYSYLFGAADTTHGDPAGRVSMLAALYFPEVFLPAQRFGMEASQQIIELSQAKIALLQAENPAAQSAVRDRFAPQIITRKRSLLTIGSTIESELSRVVREIAGLPPLTPPSVQTPSALADAPL